MIKKINKLKNCGIFRDFKWENSLPEFGRYNLFYGLNGSGKSTLSQALSFFSNQTNDKDLGEYEIEVLESNNSFVGNKTSNQTLSNPIYVFNKDFIQKNIEVNGKLDEIIYLSEENIEAKTQVEKSREEIERLKIKKEIASKAYEEKKKVFDKLAPSIALKVKNILVELGGVAAQSYNNFDRRGVEHYYSTNISQFETVVSNSDSDIDRLKTALRESSIPIISLKLEKTELAKFENAIRNAKVILSKSIKKEVVARYSKEILDWIESGLKLHSSETECSFCGGIISNERTIFLNQLFSNEYKSFIIELESAIKELQSLIYPFFELNFTLYDEYKNQAEQAVNSLNALRKKPNAVLESLIEQLLEKKSNIDKSEFENIEFDISAIALINEEIETIEKCILETNNRTNNFAKKQGEELLQLVNLLLNKFLREEKYATVLNELNKSAKEDKDLESLIFIAERNIKDIEDTIRDVFIAAKEFNNLLHQFLGRQEISLEFDSILKGYKLIRENKKAERLSDGEKTAIAFVYFLTKIRENGNKIENTIVVLDDPISSLDSNNIFNAFAFLIATFEESHQFFVLTHNFTFFSLLKRKIGRELKSGNNMYLIENTYKQVNNDKVREAKIVRLPSTLQTLNSDYAFSFKYIKDTLDACSVIANLNDYFVLSNSCRKILETFCSFKFINSDFTIETVKDLYRLNGADGSIATEEIAKAEKIFRFVNYYSHGGKFSVVSEIDGIIGEALSIAQSIVELIERADKAHYDQLLQAVAR